MSLRYNYISNTILFNYYQHIQTILRSEHSKYKFTKNEQIPLHKIFENENHILLFSFLLCCVCNKLCAHENGNMLLNNFPTLFF